MKSVVLAAALVALSASACKGAPPHAASGADSRTRAVAAALGPAARHEFTPSVFYRQFSARTAPVLTISPGDSIHTTTLDAGGDDEMGRKRSQPGNPQTGPFFVTGAMPGDTLAVQ